MTELVRPWADPTTLENMLAGIRQQFGARPLFRVVVGQGWLRLHLEGEERPAVWLTWLPGANLVFSTTGPIDPTLKRALPPIRKHPLPTMLKEATLTGAGLFPGDRVAAFRLAVRGGSDLFLLHQLFGARGNTVLLDDQAKLLWSRHRPPATLLANLPPLATWTTGQAGDVASGVSRLALGHLTTRLTATALQRHTTSLGRVKRSSDRLVANLSRDFEQADRGEQYRRQAETLAAHLHTLQPGQDTLETADLRDGHPLKIALDPALTPAANLEAWFRRARKAEKGRQVILDRLEEATQQADLLTLAAQRLEDIAASNCEELDCLEALLDWHQAHAALLPAAGGQAAQSAGHGPEEPARPFRRYLIDGRFEVWVGRNNKENDVLTHRASHGRDLWFHAQGVSGSHVILRTGGHPENVSRMVLEKAAALAALNSKARHASLVPVIYTERRYVRKPRKAPPGTAACLREKSVFVEPGIMSGVQAT